MDLKEFISKSLKDIIDAVIESHNHYEGKYISAIPWRNGAKGQPLTDGSDRPIQDIEFDIAVSVEGGSSGTAGSEIKVLGIASLGGKLESQSAETKASRIKFSIPIALPVKSDLANKT